MTLTADIEVRPPVYCRLHNRCCYHAYVFKRGELVDACAHCSPNAAECEVRAKQWIESDKGQYRIGVVLSLISNARAMEHTS